MVPIDDVVREFLSQQRMAVAGVSRSGSGAANAILDKLRKAGRRVTAVNPNATELDGEPCYPHLSSVPGGVDAVVAVTPPRETERLVDQCVEAGIAWIWMHRSPMGNSVSEEAVARCREHRIGVIGGGCPMMFEEPVDVGHRCMKWLGRITGAVPGRADPPAASFTAGARPPSAPPR